MPSDEKPHLHKYEPLPIPTYEEATGSRPSTSAGQTNEPGDNEEREGLLGGDARAPPAQTRRQGYRPPTVEDGRESLDALDLLGPDEVRSSAEDDEVRREIEELEIEEPPAGRSKWGQRISHIKQSLLPLRRWTRWMPKWSFKMPQIDVSLWLLIARVVAVGIVVGMAYLLFVSDIFSNAATRMQATMYDPERVRLWYAEQVNPDIIRENLQHLTRYDHLAGTKGDFALSTWVQQQFVEAGLENVVREQYDVYLNYPIIGGRVVEILNADGSVKWTARLEEDYTPEPDHPTAGQAQAFHGHSKSGDVKGPLIYANYGSRDDFKRLKDMHIDTKGAIALVRYYGTQGDRALKVKAAELAGFAGCLIYSDPNEDGFVKGPAWPEGRYMPADGVQRGAVSMMSWVVGDVLSPGWASTPDKPRLSPNESPGLVQIPSLPLAWRDAQVLLQSLKGYGSHVPEASWMGGVPEVEWWTGNLSSPTVHLKNEQEEVERQPIWNIMGKIKGIEQSEKSIIIGNHRDAWAFGAADPGSGTAVLLEIIRIFGELKRHGWRPLRTIEFASWDGEEYNLIGSTEYVENNIARLREDGYAYLNVDVAVSGQDFFADASPAWHDSLMRVLDRVRDPSKNGSTLLEIWNQDHNKLGSLGAGSDYVAFQDLAGVSSIDFGFRGEEFPYHSVHDNFDWMNTVGDPGFQYHTMLGQVWGLLVLEMSDAPILPMSLKAYASTLQEQVEELNTYAMSKGANEKGKVRWDVGPLRAAAHNAEVKAAAFELWGHRWDSIHNENGNYESTPMMDARLKHNQRAGMFESLLLDLSDGGGLKDRTQYKHVLFAPQKWSGYDSAFFPAVRDAIDDGDWDAAYKAVDKAAELIVGASENLVVSHQMVHP